MSRIIFEHCKTTPANEVPHREHELSESDNCMSKMKTRIAKITKDEMWKSVGTEEKRPKCKTRQFSMCCWRKETIDHSCHNADA